MSPYFSVGVDQLVLQAQISQTKFFAHLISEEELREEIENAKDEFMYRFSDKSYMPDMSEERI